MLGLVGATVSVMTFTYLVVLFECLLLSMMWFICAAWFQTNKERKKKRNTYLPTNFFTYLTSIETVICDLAIVLVLKQNRIARFMVLSWFLSKLAVPSKHN